MRDEKGHITGSRSFTADGRLRNENFEDKEGNRHFINYDKTGKVCGERHENKDGSHHGWARESGRIYHWNKDANGNDISGTE